MTPTIVWKAEGRNLLRLATAVAQSRPGVVQAILREKEGGLGAANPREGWGIGGRSPSVMTLPSRGPDTYYYLLREMNTVAGIAAKNGTPVEAYHYDAYGKVTLWGFSPADFNRGERSERERVAIGKANRR